MQWQVVKSDPTSAVSNMQEDDECLHHLSSSSPPHLRFYSWERPSITHGYFIQPEKHLKVDRLVELGWDLARRPTGGGIVFHTHDLAFSALLPATHPRYAASPLENYAYINQKIAAALARYLGEKGRCQLMDQHFSDGVAEFCFAQPTRYDVIIQGRKVGGAAQRKTKLGILHQGSLLLSLPPRKLMEEFFIDQDSVVPKMFALSYPLLGREAGEVELATAKKELITLITEEFQQKGNGE